MPATPNSQLQKKHQTEIKRQGFKIKVVKKAGVAIKRLLQKSDPFKPRQCGREDCPVCRTEGEGPCNRESVTYEIKCIGCNNVYVGETSRSAYTRGKEHSKSLGNKEERSALWKHCREKHSSEIQQFQMTDTGVLDCKTAVSFANASDGPYSNERLERVKKRRGGRMVRDAKKYPASV